VPRSALFNPQEQIGTFSLLLTCAAPASAPAHTDGAPPPPGRHIALVGDAELDEGNVFETLLETWKLDVRNNCAPSWGYAPSG
jgi:hypothetical protein